MASVKCPDCDLMVRMRNDGSPYKHLCLVPNPDPGGPLLVDADKLPGEFEPTEFGPTLQDVVSDPAPTVEVMDDKCSEPTCNCEGHGGPVHELALIGAFDEPVPAEHQPGRPPAPAEVSYWQQQAREAAGRHVEQVDTDTPYVALLKEARTAVPIVEIRLPAAPGPMPTPDEFMDPAKPEEKLNVSGQPPARRDHLKRYIVVDPDLGDFRRTVKEKKPKGITRATTFNKHAQNTIALNGWSKRNVVMGASLRPDILRRAHGLTHETGKQELDRIVDELETAAGAKVSANEGTFLHEFCEQVDAGLKTWQDAPPAYRPDIRRYVNALAAEGLVPVPGLIERTTYIREFGGVCGTFDRVFYHQPSGQYLVGDQKTGKTMKYAMDETECQIWTYAHGVNQTGIYDWNTDTWGPAQDLDRYDPAEWGHAQLQVSETVGVVVHMPVQGPEAGEVYLRFANLERGRAYAELNHAVTSYEKSKVLPFEMPELSWEQRFAAVTSGEHANQLWREARAAGITGPDLNDLVAVARTALAGKG